MEEISALEERIHALERRWRWTAALTGVCVVGAFLAWVTWRSPQILQARGLVIVDAAGKPRVVLGAPMANASSDEKLAKTTGLAVLDGSGKLNVAVGASNPLVESSGKPGNRIHAGFGLTIYDPRTGGERGGFGTLADGRANACLDYGADKEAVCMFVNPKDDAAGVLVNATPGEEGFDRVAMMVLADGSGAIKLESASHSGFLFVADKGAPQVRVMDTGKEIEGVGLSMLAPKRR